MMGEVIRVSANRPNVRDFLREEMLSQKFADVTLCCSDGQRFFVHRIVLSAASAYLQEMLLSHMKSTNTCEPITVILAEIEAPELAALLGFVYTGSASIPGERLDALLRAAETLHIQLPVLPSSSGDFSSSHRKIETKGTTNPGFLGCSRYPASLDDYLRVSDCGNSESGDCNCTGAPKLQSPMGTDQKLEQLHQRKQGSPGEEAFPGVRTSPHYYYYYHCDKKSLNGQSKSRVPSTECLDYSQPLKKRMTTTTTMVPIEEYRLPAGTGTPGEDLQADEGPGSGRKREEKEEEMDGEEEEDFDERVLGKDLRQGAHGNRWKVTRRRIVANRVTASPWRQLARPHHSPKVPPMVLQLQDEDVADKDSEPRDLRHLHLSSSPLEQRSPIRPVATTSRLVEDRIIPFPGPLESATSQLTCLSLSGSTTTPVAASAEFYHPTRHYHHHHQHQQHHQIKPNEDEERDRGAIEQPVPLDPTTAFPRPADVRNLVTTTTTSSSSSLSSTERLHVQERPSNRETDQRHVRGLLGMIAPTTTSFASPAEETPQRCPKPEISHPVSRLCDTVSETAGECLGFGQFESVGGKVPIDIVRSVVSDNNNNDASGVQPQRGVDRSSEHHKCEECGKTFVTRASLKVHSRTHSGEKPFRCADCGKEFSQLRNYKYHRSVHEGTREFAATCPECGKYFNDRGYLSSHMKIHRNRKEYVCSECGKSFNQRVAYNMHVRIHTGVKPHQCEQCGKSFSRKMLLKQHLRTHSGERPYQCQVCHKAFADRSNMTLHTRLHSGLKPYQCTLCSKAFTKKHHLKTHLNYHTGTKPYSCPNCSLKFSQSSNMRTHYKKCLLNGSPGDAKATMSLPVEDQRTLTPPTSDQESSLLSSIARSSAATTATVTAAAAMVPPTIRN